MTHPLFTIHYSLYHHLPLTTPKLVWNLLLLFVSFVPENEVKKGTKSFPSLFIR